MMMMLYTQYNTTMRDKNILLVSYQLANTCMLYSPRDNTTMTKEESIKTFPKSTDKVSLKI
jgi:hypothetical protein